MANEKNANEPATAPAMLSIFDGDGNPFAKPCLLRVHNGQDVNPLTYSRQGPNVSITVPFHDGVGVLYAVSVSSDGYRDGGCFFKANPGVLAEPVVLMLPKDPSFKFEPWADFKAAHPRAATFLSTGCDDATAEAHYAQSGRTKPRSLACLLNLTQAMAEIDFGDGKTPLEFFREICWDDSMAQDRFFGYIDRALIPIVRAAAAKGQFSEEVDCAKFHPGATHSWKQIAFPVTNVQLTFHENDTKVIGGISCVKIEPDIDLFKELLAHGFGEVFPNLITGNLTDPTVVFSFRWTLAKDAGGSDFDPGYDLV